MPYITVSDGTRIYYKDWGNKSAQPFVFSHGWPLNSDDWERQMFFLSSNGYRTIAHDRRGHGRSDQPWNGNDMDTYADDLLDLFQQLDLNNVILVGHSAGGGEVARFLGRHGSSRVAKAVLISSIPPLLVKTEKSPDGVPSEVLESFRAAMMQDRSKFFLDVPTGPFFGFNRPDSEISQGRIWKWWQAGMQCGLKNVYDCIKTFEEDYTADLKSISIPVLVLHGDDDQIVPIEASGRLSAALVQNGKLKVMKGAPHALPAICADEVNRELLDFVK